MEERNDGRIGRWRERKKRGKKEKGLEGVPSGWATMTKYCRLGGLNNRNVFPQHSGS